MSSGVKFVYGRGPRRQHQTVIDKLNKTSKQLKESSNKRQRTLAGMSLILYNDKLSHYPPQH
jgi:hypothetical protein